MAFSNDLAAICRYEAPCTHTAEDHLLSQDRVNEADDESKQACDNKVRIHSGGAEESVDSDA